MRLFFEAAAIDTGKWLNATKKYGVGSVGPDTYEEKSAICFNFLEGEENGAEEVRGMAEKAGLVFVKATDEVVCRRDPKTIDPPA